MLSVYSALRTHFDGVRLCKMPSDQSPGDQYAATINRTYMSKAGHRGRRMCSEQYDVRILCWYERTD